MASTSRPQPAPDPSETGRVSYVDRVRNELREDILAGRLEPGERVQIRALTRRFSMSHIPVREESEGLVVSSPANAIFVTGLHLDDLASLYDVRRMVECPLSQQSAPLLSDLHIATIFELLGNLSELEAGSSEFRQVHKRFHRALLAPCLSHWTETVLEQLWRGSERYVRLYISHFGSVAQGMEHHRLMAQACAARDGERLAEITHEHLLGTQRAIEHGYSELPPGSRPEPKP
jgi:GntR family carbon starvation induced transcriptional regulator